LKLLSDENIEELVLATVLLYGEEQRPILTQRFHPDLFYARGKHKIIATAIHELITDGVSIDMLNVVARLDRQDKLEEAGGRLYFNKLIDQAWTDSMLENHLNILREFRIKRMAERSAFAIADMAGRKDSDVLEIQRFAGELAETILVAGNGKQAAFIGELIDNYSNNMIERALSKDFGLTSGFHSIDDKLRGMQPAYYILAGRPGNGKTVFALNMAYRQARKGHTVGFLSIEMREEALVERLTSIHMKHSWYDQPTDLTKEQFTANVRAAHMDLAKLPLIIDDTAYKTVEDAVSAAYTMRFASKRPIEVLYIDYVQLLSVTNKPEDLSNVSHRLNALKKDLGIPIVAVAQINREVRDRKGHRPVLTDLKGSGSFEEDADVVMFVFDPDQWSEHNSAFELIIAKHRNGPLAMGDGALPFFFDKPAQRFEQGEKEW